MNEAQPTENPFENPLKSSIPKLLGAFWIVAALLLMLCFFMSNFSMVFKEFSGFEMVKIVFKDTESLRKVGDTTSFLLMVTVPILYFGLAIYALVVGISSIGKNKLSSNWIFTIVSGIVLLVSILGMFMIGNEAAEVALVSKFMPKPSGGYYFAFFLQLLLFLSGLFTIWQDSNKAQKA